MMNISEMINQLEQFKEKHGDIIVSVEDDYGFYEIDHIRHDEVLDKKKCDGTQLSVLMIKRKHYSWEGAKC